MTTIAPPVLPDSRRETLRILLVVQGAIFVMSAFESTIASLAFPSPLGILGSLAFAGAFFWFARAAGRGRTLRALIWFERSLLVWFAVDSLLSLAMAHRPLELVPTITRLVLPVVVLRMTKAMGR